MESNSIVLDKINIGCVKIKYFIPFLNGVKYCKVEWYMVVKKLIAVRIHFNYMKTNDWKVHTQQNVFMGKC